MIGGGGKNIGGTILYLLNSGRVQNIEFALFGRTYKNMERNIALANRIKNHNGCSIKVYDTLESALEGADIVMHCATAGYGEYGGYRSYGVPQGGHVMYVGEKISKLCPDAWVLGATNPPEVPLTALLKRFGIEKSIGLCNAPMIVKNTLSAISGTDEKNILMRGIGLNHDVGITIFESGRNGENRRYAESKDRSTVSFDHPWFRLFGMENRHKEQHCIIKGNGYLLFQELDDLKVCPSPRKSMVPS